MITGKYTGLIEIDFHIDADKPGYHCRIVEHML